MLRSGFTPYEPSVPAPAEDLVGEVIAAFQPYYPDPISRDRGTAMKRNLADVLLMLSEWKREDDVAAAAPDPLPPEPPAPAPPRHYRPKRRKFPAETP